ncbi:MAG TPA: adenylate/guanylate cyclase domain-containing protein [Candidatus Eremiobacteraceae bacterium]
MSDSARSVREEPAGVYPSGTISFLFSDIEGSTKRWDEQPDAMQHALRRHDDLMRAAIRAHRGHVFKTIGDAFCAAFRTAPDAVAAALDAQLAIEAEPWPVAGGLSVRMAIHAGLADERDGDYFGTTVNRVARLMAIAHGGQILVSGAAAGLLGGAPELRDSLRDLGKHRLRDLAQPEQVHQVVAPKLRQLFPPLRSVDSLPNNLPLQLTNFVGRDEDVGEIEKLLTGARLVTVIGTGGIGKTRTALQVAADLLDDMPDGTWFVDLAPIKEQTPIASAIALALGLRESVERPPLETVLDNLAQRKLMLVLDNCEHVITEAARSADTLLRNCAGLKILATSRERLNIGGEHVYVLPSLSVPVLGVRLKAEDARRYGAIELFENRALASDSRFRLTDENVEIVADVCRRLDGIALAIELAAPRLKIFSVRQLAEKLDERFRLLTGGSRSALPRQQTMRALIDWSYDLLTEPERVMFRSLGVFTSGWTLEAAVAICADASTSEWEVLERLSALVEKSLVQVETDAETMRYRSLESTRQYAREALELNGELAARLRAHCTYYLGVARRVDELFVGQGKSDEAYELANKEADNFRASLTWALSDGNDLASGCETAACLSILWTRSLRFEGWQWLNAALRSEPADPRLTAATLLALSRVLPDGKDRVLQVSAAVAAYRRVDDVLGLASSLSSEAEARRAIGEYAAATAAQTEGLELYRAHGAPAQVAAALLTLGSIETIVDRRETARRLLEEARMLNPRNGSIATNLAELEFADGNFESAVDYGLEALEYFRRRHPSNACIALCNLAAYSLALGRIEDARVFAREGLEIAHGLHASDLIALAIQHLASVACASGKPERAARLLGFVDSQFAKLGLQRDTSEHFTYDRLRVTLADSFSGDAMSIPMAEGGTMSEDRAFAEAMND